MARGSNRNPGHYVDNPEERQNYSQVTVISCPRIAGYPLTSNASSFSQPMPHRAMQRFPSCFSTRLANMLIGCTCLKNMLISGGYFDRSRRYVYGVYMFFGRVDSGSRIRQAWCGGWVFFGGVGHGRCRVGHAIRRGPTCGREPACGDAPMLGR